MNENELKIAAFAKMVRGESLTVQDAQRVWEVVLLNGRRIDSANQQNIGQFLSQVKSQLHQIFFSE